MDGKFSTGLSAPVMKTPKGQQILVKGATVWDIVFEIVLKNDYTVHYSVHMCIYIYIHVLNTWKANWKAELAFFRRQFRHHWDGVTWNHRARHGLQRSLWGVVGSKMISLISHLMGNPHAFWKILPCFKSLSAVMIRQCPGWHFNSYSEIVLTWLTCGGLVCSISPIINELCLFMAGFSYSRGPSAPETRRICTRNSGLLCAMVAAMDF